MPREILMRVFGCQKLGNCEALGLLSQSISWSELDLTSWQCCSSFNCLKPTCSGKAEQVGAFYPEHDVSTRSRLLGRFTFKNQVTQQSEAVHIWSFCQSCQSCQVNVCTGSCFEVWGHPSSLLGLPLSPQLWLVVVGWNMQVQHIVHDGRIMQVQLMHNTCVCVIDTMQMSQLSSISSIYLANSMIGHSIQCNRTEEDRLLWLYPLKENRHSFDRMKFGIVYHQWAKHCNEIQFQEQKQQSIENNKKSTIFRPEAWGDAKLGRCDSWKHYPLTHWLTKPIRQVCTRRCHCIYKVWEGLSIDESLVGYSW